MDTTHLPTREGALYLAVVLDASTRQVVGWSMARTQTAELMCRAAVERRTHALIHHLDQGNQYASGSYQCLCRDLGIEMSMGSGGDCYNNAMAESWFATLKREGLSSDRCLSVDDTQSRVIDYIEGFYNTPSRIRLWETSVRTPPKNN